MQYCQLHFDGREFTVFIHLALIEALQKEISRASSESSGLLLGRGNEGAAIISSYAPQIGRQFVQNKNQFWSQFASWSQKRADGCEVLGYYRLASGADPAPDKRDLRVMREFLPESASMLLLIGTSQGGNIGSAFVWGAMDRQQLLAGKTKLQFPNAPRSEAGPRDSIESREHVAWRSKLSEPFYPSDWKEPTQMHDKRGDSNRLPFALSLDTGDLHRRTHWEARTPCCGLRNCGRIHHPIRRTSH